MSHSPGQNKKKADAMEEAQRHMQHSNVMQTRDGKDHEMHKEDQVRREDDERMRGTY